MKKRTYLNSSGRYFLICLLTIYSLMQGQAQTFMPKKVLITNVNVFNGVDNTIYINQYILIEKNLIRAIGGMKEAPGDVDEIIDGKGYYAMPGLIDAHTHLLQETVTLADYLNNDISMINFIGAEAAKQQLLRGFTTVRNMGGGAITLAKAIDQGLAIGPRVYPSGAFIGQTGGHGDGGLYTDVPREHYSYAERQGIFAIADGVDQVLLKSREQLRQGATQLKLMAGGGISSTFDPIDVMQYGEDEFRAAVESAKNWDTYVAVHAYNDASVQRAIRGGVKSIEHGHLIRDKKTVEMMRDSSVWWSIQPFYFDELSVPNAKNSPVYNGTDSAFCFIRPYNKKDPRVCKEGQYVEGVNLAFGADLLFSKQRAATHGQRLAAMHTRFGFGPFATLKMATSDNARLLKMSGNRNPYPEAELGVLKAGAFADLLIIKGNPLENIRLIENPGQNLALIMKDGKIYKNQLEVLPQSEMRIAAGYVAKYACSYTFLSNIDTIHIDRALRDLLNAGVIYQVDDSTYSVTASLGEVTRTAHFFGINEGDKRGCVLDGISSKVKKDSSRQVDFKGIPIDVKAKRVDRNHVHLKVKDGFNALQALLRKTLEDHQDIFAITVANRTDVLAEAYQKGVSQNSRLLGWSMTKTLGSTLMGLFADDGKWTPGARTGFTAWNDTIKGQKNIRSLITGGNIIQMSSGLKWTEAYEGLSDATRMLYLESDMAGYALKSPQAQKPNTIWYYSSGSSNLLAKQLKDGLKKGYLNYPQEKLFKPLGMQSAMIETDSAGHFVFSSYAWATARDWTKFGQLYLNRGRDLKGNQVLSEAWVDYALQPADASGNRYGAQIWLNHVPPRSPNSFRRFPSVPQDAYFANGYGGQRILIIPSRNLVITMLSGNLEAFDADAFYKAVLLLNK